MSAITSNRHAMRRKHLGYAMFSSADRLQSLLLAKPKPKAKRKPLSQDFYDVLGYSLIGLFVALMARFCWLPGGGV